MPRKFCGYDEKSNRAVMINELDNGIRKQYYIYNFI